MERSKRGRPKVTVTAEVVVSLKAQGLSFRQIARKLGVGASTAHKLIRTCPELRRNGPLPRS